MEILFDYLKSGGFEFYENFNSSQISSIRLGMNLSLAIFPHSLNELKKLLKFLYRHKIYYRVFGNLSNVLIISNLTHPVIITSKMQAEISFDENKVTVSAGTMLSKFCELLRKNSLSGLEGLCGIPATVGGAIFNNAGAFGYHISDRLVSISVFFEGKILKISKFDIKFDYHKASLFGFIVLDATFLFENRKEYDIIKMSNEFTYRRNLSQPSGFSLGSVFKRCNNTSAGFYIERSGLKGARAGDIVISKKHSNFFINVGCGCVSDFLYLEKLTKDCVKNSFGVTLYTEIEKVG